MSRPETTTVLWASLFNAITRAIPTDRFVSLSEREAITAAVWDEMQPEIRRLDQRAEQAEAELEQWHACFGETALKDARGVLAERDQLRAAVERVREIHKREVIPLRHWETEGCKHCGIATWPCPTLAALDQAPAAEPVKRTIEEALDIIDGQFAEDRAAEQDGGEPEEAKPRRVTSGAITNLMIYQAPPPSGYGPGAIGEAYRLGLRHGRGGR